MRSSSREYVYRLSMWNVPLSVVPGASCRSLRGCIVCRPVVGVVSCLSVSCKLYLHLCREGVAWLWSRVCNRITDNRSLRVCRDSYSLLESRQLRLLYRPRGHNRDVALFRLSRSFTLLLLGWAGPPCVYGALLDYSMCRARSHFAPLTGELVVLPESHLRST